MRCKACDRPLDINDEELCSTCLAVAWELLRDLEYADDNYHVITEPFEEEYGATLF